MNCSQHKWFEETKLTWFEQFMIKIIKCGQIPRHIAIIMDGNRRYAKKLHLEQLNCYNLGFEKIRDILKYSHHLGIEEITIFAFSIENFKRDQSETDLLMNLAIEKFSLLLNEKDELIKNDVCIRFIGNLELLPAKLQKLISELMLITLNHQGRCLNICMAYTSTYDFESAALKLYNAINRNILKNDELSKKDLETCLLTYRSKSDPELLVRTSGEIRLSDFLLWQSNYSTLAFIEVLWPETTFFEFSKLILKYQFDKKMHYNSGIKQVIQSNRSNSEDQNKSDLKKFVDSESERTLIKFR